MMSIKISSNYFKRNAYLIFLEMFCPYPKMEINKALETLFYVGNISYESAAEKLLELVREAVEIGDYESLESVDINRVVLDYLAQRQEPMKWVKADIKQYYPNAHLGLGIAEEGFFWVDKELDLMLKRDKKGFKLLNASTHYFLKHAIKI